MLSRVTNEDSLAIFQKLAPVSFSRVFRTCKWANQFIEDNKHKIKIRTFFGLNLEHRAAPTEITDWSRLIISDVTIRPYRAENLSAILSEVRFQCFEFEYVEYTPLSRAGRKVIPEVATVSARKLILTQMPDAPVSTLPYNCGAIHITRIEWEELVTVFKLTKMHKNLHFRLSGPIPPAARIAQITCEKMQEIIEGRFAVKRMSVDLSVHRKLTEENPVEPVDKFVEEKGRNSFALAEDLTIHVVPVSPTSFLAIERDSSDTIFAFGLIEHRESLYAFCCISYDNFGVAVPSIEDFERLPAIQRICGRFFA